MTFEKIAGSTAEEKQEKVAAAWNRDQITDKEYMDIEFMIFKAVVEGTLPTETSKSSWVFQNSTAAYICDFCEKYEDVVKFLPYAYAEAAVLKMHGYRASYWEECIADSEEYLRRLAAEA